MFHFASLCVCFTDTRARAILTSDPYASTAIETRDAKVGDQNFTVNGRCFPLTDSLTVYYRSLGLRFRLAAGVKLWKRSPPSVPSARTEYSRERRVDAVACLPSLPLPLIKPSNCQTSDGAFKYRGRVTFSFFLFFFPPCKPVVRVFFFPFSFSSQALFPPKKNGAPA